MDVRSRLASRRSPEARKRCRSARRRAALAALAAGAWLLAASSSALGAFASCTYDPGSLTVTAIVDPLSSTAGVLARSGDAIVADGTPCEAATGDDATVHDTDLIVVVGNGAFDQVQLDLSGGPFAPGATGEALPFAEIEILLTGTTGTGNDGVEHLEVHGSSAAEFLVAGSGGPAEAIGGVGGSAAANDVPIVNLNAVPASSFPVLPADVDGDVFVDAGSGGPQNIWLFGGPNADFLSGAGGAGTGGETGPTASPVAISLDEGLRLFGEAGDDTLEGGDGDDLFVGGLGNDVMDGRGEAGNFDCDPQPDVLLWSTGDVVTYLNGPGPVAVDLDPGGQHPGVALGAQGHDVIQNMEGVVGSPGNDLLSGDADRQVIVGWLGNDTIVGEEGDDCLGGQGGTDTVSGGQGADVVHGEAGIDILLGGPGDDTVIGGAGTDGINGQAGDDQLLADDDQLDVVAGGPGADTADVDRPGDGSPVADLVALVESIF